MHPYLSSLLGGVILGLGAALLLFGNGRIAGISGIAYRVFEPSGEIPKGETAILFQDRLWRLAFLLGLSTMGVLFGALLPEHFSSLAPRSPWLIAAAGLLTGVGTSLANGCTSGHGVCGLGRGSLRSLAATLTFMIAGIATVTLTRLL
jgi:uncharacterized protein